MDIEKLKSMVEGSDASDWQINTEAGRTVAFNLIPRIHIPGKEPRLNPQPKEVLLGDLEKVKLTLYDRHGESIGSSAKELTSSSETYLQETISELLENAHSQNNPLYKLTEAGLEYEDVEIADPKITSSDLAALKRSVLSLRDAMLEEADEEGVELSNIEVYLRDTESRLLTSRGIDLSQPATEVHAEFCILARDGDEVAEYTAALRGRRLVFVVPEVIVPRYASYARDLCRAVKPKEHEGVVVITGDAVVDFFAPQTLFGSTPFRHHLLGDNVYAGASIFEIGKRICDEFKGERITLISDPRFSYEFGSTSFSPVDGVPMHKEVLIDQGVIRTFLTSKQMFDYLGLAEKGLRPTGPMSNALIIGANELSESDLLEGDSPIYVVKAFSAFTPNDESGDFACEIRLGEVIDGGTRYPISGGLLIGNYFEALKHAYFSQEIANMGSYAGPVAVRFESLKVSGE